MYALNHWSEPHYLNRFGMNESEQDSLIAQKIEEFCQAALHETKLCQFNRDTKMYQNLYTMLFEYIQENLEKFLSEVDNEFD